MRIKGQLQLSETLTDLESAKHKAGDGIPVASQHRIMCHRASLGLRGANVVKTGQGATAVDSSTSACIASNSSTLKNAPKSSPANHAAGPVRSIRARACACHLPHTEYKGATSEARYQGYGWLTKISGQAST